MTDFMATAHNVTAFFSSWLVVLLLAAASSDKVWVRITPAANAKKFNIRLIALFALGAALDLYSSTKGVNTLVHGLAISFWAIVSGSIVAIFSVRIIGWKR